MAYVVMAYVVMACMVMAYVVMALPTCLRVALLDGLDLGRVDLVALPITKSVQGFGGKN